MTVNELAAKLEADAQDHPRKGVRRRCTPERCRRVAEYALSKQGITETEIVEGCASHEPSESRRAGKRGPVDSTGYGFAWLALLLPLFQILLQFLAERAVAHIQDDT